MRLSEYERLIVTAALVASRTLRRIVGVAGLICIFALGPLSLFLGWALDDPRGPQGSHNAAALGFLGSMVFLFGGAVAVLTWAATAFLAWCAGKVQRDIKSDW
jgi:hypothetical protein